MNLLLHVISVLMIVLYVTGTILLQQTPAWFNFLLVSAFILQIIRYTSERNKAA